ncbi:hypothetical protein HK098_001952 [Nowakowskiella sp. JEL0407]|nr:hypothetical protein HK098_001952 [Nowakowskiella sp. JEL0407]
MASLQAIPTEALLKIASFLPRTSAITSPIFNLAQANKYFYRTLIPILYEEVHTEITNDFESFKNLIRNTPTLYEKICENTICFRTTFPNSDVSLPQFKKLRFLHVYFKPHSVYYNYSRFCKDVDFSHLHTLTLSDTYWNGRTIDSLNVLFSKCNSLSVLFIRLQTLSGTHRSDEAHDFNLLALTVAKLQNLNSFTIEHWCRDDPAYLLTPLFDSLSSISTLRTMRIDGRFEVDENTGQSLTRLLRGVNLRNIYLHATIPNSIIKAVQEIRSLNDVHLEVRYSGLEVVFDWGGKMPKKLSVHAKRLCDGISNVVGYVSGLESFSYGGLEAKSMLSVVQVVQTCPTVQTLQMSMIINLDENGTSETGPYGLFLKLIATSRTLRHLDLELRMEVENYPRFIDVLFASEYLESLKIYVAWLNFRPILLAKLSNIKNLRKLTIKSDYSDVLGLGVFDSLNSSSPLRLISFVEHGDEQVYSCRKTNRNVKFVEIFKLEPRSSSDEKYVNSILGVLQSRKIDRIVVENLSRADFRGFKQQLKDSAMEFKFGYVDGELCAHL